jgi:hypothetical protein
MRHFRCLLLAAFLTLLISGCKTEEVPPVIPSEVVIRHLNQPLRLGMEPYQLDLDSNGFTDYRILVSGESTVNRSKAIFRVEGVINGILTTVVHGTLRELSEEQQCDVLYPSVLEASMMVPAESVSEAIGLDWWMIGDFHHNDFCFGSSCACPGSSADVEYIPLPPGGTGYIGLRFIRRARKHYGWMEVQRSASVENEYLLKRVAWRRSPEQPLVIE